MHQRRIRGGLVGRYLLQRIAVAVERGNIAAVLGMTPVGSDLTDTF